MLKNIDTPQNLFSSGLIQSNFFSVLNCPNQAIYLDCLFIIYKQASYGLSFGIEKNLITDLLQDYFEGKGGDLVEDGEVYKNNRDKATSVLRKLKECGWLIEEDTSDYETYLNLQDIAVDMIKTLHSYSSNKGVEYKGYISTIYTLIRSSDTFDDKSDLLRQIYENTHFLISGLKTLHSNIKKYIERLSSKKNVDEILSSVFEEYRADVIDKAYNRLITSDNVHKFRPAIIEGLENFARDMSFIEEAGKGFAEKEECGIGEGMEEAKEMIDQIIYAFNNLDMILHAIKVKNAKYHRNAINSALFISNNTADIVGQINTILSFIKDDSMEKGLSLDDIYECDDLENLFTIQSLGYIDETSLYKPRNYTRTTVTEVHELENVEELSDDDLRNDLKKQMNKGINKRKIKKMIDKMLEDKDVVKASEANITDDTGYMDLIFTYLYADDKKIGYEIVETNRTVKKGKYTFKDFEIRRKS